MVSFVLSTISVKFCEAFNEFHGFKFLAIQFAKRCFFMKSCGMNENIIVIHCHCDAVMVVVAMVMVVWWC
jgi:hypothetical protein